LEKEKELGRKIGKDRKEKRREGKGGEG